MEIDNSAKTIKWDLRYLKLAREVSNWSKDPSTKFGAVIVNGRNEFLGYNGFPHKLKDNEEDYAEREIKYSKVIHCEMNAVLKAGPLAVGATLYTWPFMSCDRCAVHMIQAGIERVVAPKLPEHLEERWANNLNKSRAYFKEAGVLLTETYIDFNLEGWSLNE